MTTKVTILPLERIQKIDFVVIVSMYKDSYLFVRHKKRTTLEIPGGKVEEKETPEDAAKRELEEETGALKYSLEKLFIYEVKKEYKTDYGMVFAAEITAIGALPDSEIGEVSFERSLPQNLTYPFIQTKIFNAFKEKRAFDL